MAAAILSVLSASPPATAHSSENGQDSANQDIRPFSYNSTWMPPMNAAISQWNGHPEVSIAKLSGVDSFVVVGNYNAGWLGRYTNYRNKGYFRIQLDSYSLSRHQHTFYFCVRSTFTHEWGHVFNLDHNSLNSSIMRVGRDHDLYYNPNQHDRDDVSVYY